MRVAPTPAPCTAMFLPAIKETLTVQVHCPAGTETTAPSAAALTAAWTSWAEQEAAVIVPAVAETAGREHAVKIARRERVAKVMKRLRARPSMGSSPGQLTVKLNVFGYPQYAMGGPEDMAFG